MQKTVSDHITEYADNFLPQTLKPYLTTDVKKELGEKISTALVTAMNEKMPYGSGPVNYMRDPTEFTRSERKFADRVSQYIMQGTGMSVESSRSEEHTSELQSH